MHIKVDTVILGGGIAGLWTLNCLRRAGYQAILLEKSSLGDGQTIQAQGMIHGGAKYTLQGTLNNKLATVIDTLPQYWNKCLAGTGEIDLSRVQRLSDYQYLWSASRLTETLSNLFLKNMLKTKVVKLKQAQYPAILQTNPGGRHVFRMSAPVLDIKSLIAQLAAPYQNYLLKINQKTFELIFDDHHNINHIRLRLGQEPFKLSAARYIFTAGEGNAALCNGKPSYPEMQRRPLRMTVVKMLQLAPLFGHYLSHSSVPRLTFTTHKTIDGQLLWYLGGKLAETGASRDATNHSAVTRRELAALFPLLDFKTAEISSFIINRAEPRQPFKRRAASIFMKSIGNQVIGWPTKLTLAPLLGKQIVTDFQRSGIMPKAQPVSLEKFPKPEIAKPFWDC